MSSTGYQEPPWARTPPAEHRWSLTEIKGGVQVAEHALNIGSCIILGRAADQVQIPLNHDSCSRQHARIAFDESGIPWLRDLQSTHGTVVNKKKLPRQAIGRHESDSTKAGSRGVIIYPGDILQFGASTRLFCLEGPSEYGRESMKKSKPVLRENVPAPNEQIRPSDAPADLDSRDVAEDKSLANIREEDIPDKHRKEWERLKALQYKLENISSESNRIRQKGELTEGEECDLV